VAIFVVVVVMESYSCGSAGCWSTSIEDYGGFKPPALAFGWSERGREGYSRERMLVQAMAGT